MRASFLLLAAFALILIGLVLVIEGTTPGTAGGCFFWPFPVVVVCGAGVGGGPPYIFLAVGTAAVVLIAVLSYVWMRRSIAPPDT